MEPMEVNPRLEYREGAVEVEAGRPAGPSLEREQAAVRGHLSVAATKAVVQLAGRDCGLRSCRA
jgi:hypothetical protein